MPIRLPPLRERMDDIPLLAGHFVAKHSARLGKKFTGIRPEAMSILMAHDWPGNVRELENVIERAITLAKGEEISVGDLAKGRPTTGHGDLALPVDLPRKMEEIEGRYIRAALERTDGNVTKAAELLGISFRSLRYRVKKLN